METINLNNGVTMPLLGYGVFQVSPDECERCVSDALRTGYRLIDTAQAYFNEEDVGRAIAKSGVDRHDLFITTKVWISNSGDKKAAASIDESLRKLQTDYIDLLLIHQPFGDYYGTYRAMERTLADGKVRAIGVSNFRPDRFIDLIKHVDVMPAVNQLETNVFSQQTEMRTIMDATGTRLMAWSPLAQGVNNLFHHELLTRIGNRYGKSASQIALRFLTQQGIVAIPKSTHTDRMAANLDSFGFNLTDEEMEAIRALNSADAGHIDFTDPKFVNFILTAFD